DATRSSGYYRTGQAKRPPASKLDRESQFVVAMHQHKSWLWGPLSLIGLSLAVATVAVDQVHKWWMLSVFGIQGKGRVAVTPFFDLEYVRNTGVSYGLFLQETRQGQWILA